MSSIWDRNARVLSFVLLLFCFGVAYSTITSSPEFQLEFSGDSRSYYEISVDGNLSQMLSFRRPPVYPLFLRAMDLVPESFLPNVQLLLFFAASIVLYWGLLQYLGNPWVAMVGAVMPSFSPLYDESRFYMADSLGVTMLVLTIGFLLIAVSRPKRWAGWLLLGGGVLAACLTRGAYLFLIPLVPLLSGMLILGRGGGGLSVKNIVKAFTPGMIAVLLPVFLYCGLRFVVVGQFALVPASGTNMSGIACAFIDDETVANLPENLRVFGRTMLEKRKELGLKHPFDGIDSSDYYSICNSLHVQYNKNILKVGWPTARLLYGDNDVAVDKNLTRICGLILLTNLDDYYLWIKSAVLRSIDVIVQKQPLLRSLSTVSFFAFISLCLTALVFRKNKRIVNVALPPVLFAVSAMSVCTAGVLLVVLVEVPVPRYLLPPAVLLESACAVVLLGFVLGLVDCLTKKFNFLMNIRQWAHVGLGIAVFAVVSILLSSMDVRFSRSWNRYSIGIPQHWGDAVRKNGEVGLRTWRETVKDIRGDVNFTLGGMKKGPYLITLRVWGETQFVPLSIRSPRKQGGFEFKALELVEGGVDGSAEWRNLRFRVPDEYLDRTRFKQVFELGRRSSRLVVSRITVQQLSDPGHRGEFQAAAPKQFEAVAEVQVSLLPPTSIQVLGNHDFQVYLTPNSPGDFCITGMEPYTGIGAHSYYVISLESRSLNPPILSWTTNPVRNRWNQMNVFLARPDNNQGYDINRYLVRYENNRMKPLYLRASSDDSEAYIKSLTVQKLF